MNQKDFWNQRWVRDGERGGVSPIQMEDRIYTLRNKRDILRFKDILSAVKVKKFARGIELGAGAGRMTPLYLGFVKKLMCVDISEEAQKHFLKVNAGVKVEGYDVIPIQSLPDAYGKEGVFDIGISLTVIQHIHNFVDWSRALQAIQDVIKIGGYYLMHEDISANVQKREPSIHMNKFGLEDYKAILDKCELVAHKMYYEAGSNEDDLVALWKRIR